MKDSFTNYFPVSLSPLCTKFSTKRSEFVIYYFLSESRNLTIIYFAMVHKFLNISSSCKYNLEVICLPVHVLLIELHCSCNAQC